MKPIATMFPTTITVPANGTKDIGRDGDFIYIESASADCRMSVRSKDHGDLGSELLVRSAAQYKMRGRYDQIIFSNTSGSDISVTFWSGEGEANLNALSGSVSVSSPGTFDSQADQTIANSASLDVAADSTRVEAHLQPASANTGDLCVRDQGATTSEGIRINPTGLAFYVLACRGAFRVRNNSGAAQGLQYALVTT